MHLLNVMILARDYKRTVAWYKKVLGLKTKLVVAEGFDYTTLARPGLTLGVTPAKQMRVKPPKSRANNPVLMQLHVSDVRGFMKRVERSGGRILFGPGQDTHKGKSYGYGAVADIEGNPIWVVDLRE